MHNKNGSEISPFNCFIPAEDASCPRTGKGTMADKRKIEAPTGD
jgi:hypothetical protein